MNKFVVAAAVITGIAFGLAARLTLSSAPPPGGTTIYTSNVADDSVTVLYQTNLQRAVSDIDVGNSAQCVSCSRDGTRTYTGVNAGPGSNLVFINATTNQYLSEVVLSGSSHVGDIAVSPDGAKVFCTLVDTGKYVVVDTATSVVAGPFNVPTPDSSTPRPAAIDVSPDGASIFIIDTQHRQLVKLAASDGAVQQTANIDFSMVEVRVSSDGEFVVVVGDSTPQFFRTSDLGAVAGASAVDLGSQIDAASAGDTYYVLNSNNQSQQQAGSSSLSGPKGSLPANGPSIDIYVASTGKFVKSYFLGGSITPLGIAVLQDETQAFVSYTGSENNGSVLAVNLANGGIGPNGSAGAAPRRVAVNEIGTTEQISSFFLPRTLTLSIDKKGSSTKDTLIGSGYYDDGGGSGVDYVAQPVTIEIGGYVRTFTLVPNKKHTVFTFKDDTLTFVLTPRVRKASLGFYTIFVKKTPLGALINPANPLTFHFRAQGIPDAPGTVLLTNSRYRRGSRRGDIVQPHIFPAHVIVKLGGLNKDSLVLRGGFASGGTAPQALATVRLAFGKQFSRVIAGSLFKKLKGRNVWQYTAKVGKSKVFLSCDFDKDFVSINATGVELGALAEETTDFVFDAGDGAGAFRNTIHLSVDSKGKARNY